MSGTDKYSILPLCPELVVAVIIVNLHVPALCRLVCCWEFNDYHFGIRDQKRRCSSQDQDLTYFQNLLLCAQFFSLRGSLT
jgi:hypothetical protein